MLFDFNFSGGVLKKKATSGQEAEKDGEKEDCVSIDAEKEPESTASGSASKSNAKHRFQTDWLSKFPWLSKSEDSGMKCKLCIKHKKQNAFTCSSGCTNLS